MYNIVFWNMWTNGFYRCIPCCDWRQNENVVGGKMPLTIKSPNLIVKSPNLIVKSPNFIVKPPNFIVKSPNLIIKSPNLIVQSGSVVEQAICCGLGTSTSDLLVFRNCALVRPFCLTQPSIVSCVVLAHRKLMKRLGSLFHTGRL